MTRPCVEVHQLWKKYRTGARHDRLRALLPALAQGLLWRRPARHDMDERWALRDVSFQVHPGEALGIIGPNGAGKSTLLKVLSRILRPERGQVAVRGKLGALVEVAAGFHPDLSGRENIFLNGAILGMKRRDIERRLAAIVDFSGIEPHLDVPVKRYSSGMQARLGFAVAAHLEPDVLLVDEILGVGDAQFQAKCVAHMQERLQQGLAVLFISHYLPAVIGLCPRALVLDAGQLVHDGPCAAGIARYLQLSRQPAVNPAAQRLEILASRFHAARASALRPGDHFEFEVDCRCRTRLESPQFRFVVHRLDDQLCVSDIAADHCGVRQRSYDAGEGLTLRVSGRANLLRGLYTLGLTVALPGEQVLAYHDPFLQQFAVDERISTGGVADLRLAVDEICGRAVPCAAVSQRVQSGTCGRLP
jgi:ABC-type polysaccharide/polyol phosphate transport system ATPase subunit